jgi:hypoxanthine phosphoribosyltransferase
MEKIMKKTYLTYHDIEQSVQSITRNILLSDWRPEYVVGITRGGLLPATLISQYLRIPMHTLNVSLRDGQPGEDNESNCWMAEDALNGKNILVVDDINDTGATLQWIVDDWCNSCRPQSGEWDRVFKSNVRFAAIVNNEASEFTNLSFSSLLINKAEDDVWIQFPWENFWAPKSK